VEIARSSVRRPTALGARLLGLGVLLVALAVVVGSRPLLGAGCFLALLPLGALTLLRRPHVDAVLHAPPRARVGNPMTLAVDVHVTGGRSVPSLELVLRRRLLPPLHAGLAALDAGSRTRWTATTIPTSRGVDDDSALDLRATDLLGLAYCRWTLRLAGRTAVAPRVVEAPPAAGVARSAPGTELGELRPWRPGESRSLVAWRASARRGTGPGTTLVARDLAAELESAVVLGGFSCSPAADEPALEVLAAVGVTVLQQGRPLTLLLGGEAEPFADADLLLDRLAALPALPRGLGRGPGLPAPTLLVVAGDPGPTVAPGAPGAAAILAVDAQGGVRRL
jgi:uncharacterized protein (DUF58 family)